MKSSHRPISSGCGHAWASPTCRSACIAPHASAATQAGGAAPTAWATNPPRSKSTVEPFARSPVRASSVSVRSSSTIPCTACPAQDGSAVSRSRYARHASQRTLWSNRQHEAARPVCKETGSRCQRLGSLMSGRRRAGLTRSSRVTAALVSERGCQALAGARTPATSACRPQRWRPAPYRSTRPP